MGCHPAPLLDPAASPRWVVSRWLLAPEPREHTRACAPGKTRWVPALGRLQVDTCTPLGAKAAPERETGCRRRRPRPVPSQEKQQAYLGELPVSKPLHPSHARDRLALGCGSVGDDDRRPPGETFDLSPDKFPNSKFLPVLKAKDRTDKQKSKHPPVPYPCTPPALCRAWHAGTRCLLRPAPAAVRAHSCLPSRGLCRQHRAHSCAHTSQERGSSSSCTTKGLQSQGGERARQGGSSSRAAQTFSPEP